MIRVLVTGCSGFLARYLIDLLEKNRENEIHGFTDVLDFKSDRFRVEHMDIRDSQKLERLIRSLKPELVYHLAAISNVGISWKNPRLTYEVNFIGSSNLIESLYRNCPESRLVLMSSAELYGSGNKEPIPENHPTSVRNPYALSKLAMEMVGDMYTDSMAMDIVKIRSFNFAGPGQDKNFVCSDFAYQIAQIEKGKREPVIRIGNLSAVRDFSDVRDVAMYLKKIGENGQPGCLYNICSGERISIQSILDRLLSFSTAEIQVIVDKSKFRQVDTPVLVGDCRLIRETFSCYPRYDFSQTLLEILNEWRERIL